MDSQTVSTVSLFAALDKVTPNTDRRPIERRIDSALWVVECIVDDLGLPEADSTRYRRLIGTLAYSLKLAAENKVE